MIINLNMFIEQVMPRSVAHGLSKEVHDNYRSMFPTVKSRYPVYVWPNELPIDDRKGETYMAVKRIEEFLPDMDIPSLLITAEPGAVIRPEKAEWLKQKIRGLAVKDIGRGLHYLQEDNPEAIADAVVEWALEKGIVAQVEKAAA